MYQTASQFEAQMPDARLLLSDEPEMKSSLHSDQLMTEDGVRNSNRGKDYNVKAIYWSHFHCPAPHDRRPR